MFGHSRFEKGQRQPKKTQTRKGEKEKEDAQFGSNRCRAHFWKQEHPQAVFFTGPKDRPTQVLIFASNQNYMHLYEREIANLTLISPPSGLKQWWCPAGPGKPKLARKAKQATPQHMADAHETRGRGRGGIDAAVEWDKGFVCFQSAS